MSNSSVSDILATSGELKSLAPSFLPAAVSPLPSEPWQAAHFVLYKAAVSSARTLATTRNEAAVAMTAVRINNNLIVSWISLFFGSASLHRVPQRQRKRVASEVSGQSWPGKRFLIVIVVIPAGFVRQVLGDVNGERRQRQMIVEAQRARGRVGVENQSAANAAGYGVADTQLHAGNRV